MEAIVNLGLIEPDYTQETARQLEAEGIPVCFGDMLLPPLFDHEVIDSDEFLTPLHEAPAGSIHPNITLDTLLPGAGGQLAINACFTKQAYKVLKIYKEDKIKRTVEKAKQCIACKVYDRCNMLTHNMLLYKLSETKSN